MTRPIPQYLVLNRLDNEFGQYHRFVDRGSCRLAYITTFPGLRVLDRSRALDVVVVDDLGFDTVLPHARWLAEAHGGFDGVVGIPEYEVLTAARLRVELGTPGWRPEFVTAFRDKARMKEIVGGAGLRVPRYRVLDGATTADDVVGDLGLPVILKPRSSYGSIGVVLARTGAELAAALAAVEPQQFECEEFVDAPVCHVDGIRRGGALHVVSASAYINTCLDFAGGAHCLGSVLLDPGPRRDRIVAFADACLAALGLDDGPFHLELFAPEHGDLVFLEVGMRPGGAEVAFIHRELFGIDLYAEAFRASVGLPPVRPANAYPQPAGGGWVSVPEPRPLPSRVVSRTSLLGVVPEVYAEVLPEVGTVFRGAVGYHDIGGRFRLRGPDQEVVRKAALEVMRRYRVVGEPVVPRARTPEAPVLTTRFR